MPRRFQQVFREIGATLSQITDEAVSVQEGFGWLDMFKERTISPVPEVRHWWDSIGVAAHCGGVTLFAGVDADLRDNDVLRVWALYGIGGQSNPVPVMFRILWEDSARVQLRSPEVGEAVDRLVHGLRSNLREALERFAETVEELRVQEAKLSSE